MKVLITGAAGFIGSHLAERLHAAGHTVRGLDCLTDYYALFQKQRNLRDLVQRRVEILPYDLAETKLAPAVADCEVIFHLAAQPGISAHVPFEPYLRNNVIATERLLDAAAKESSLKLFVNVSTSSVYGQYATASEEAVPAPTSHYGVTKLAAEQLCLARQRERGFPACSIRLFSVYGPRERPEKLFPRLIRAIDGGTPFPLYEGSAEHRRSFTYVGDAVAGLAAAVDRTEKLPGEVINIGSDEEFSTGDGIALVEELMGHKVEIAHKPRRPGDQLLTKATIDRARDLLDFQPTTSFRDGLKAEIDWLKELIAAEQRAATTPLTKPQREVHPVAAPADYNPQHERADHNTAG